MLRAVTLCVLAMAAVSARASVLFTMGATEANGIDQLCVVDQSTGLASPGIPMGFSRGLSLTTQSDGVGGVILWAMANPNDPTLYRVDPTDGTATLASHPVVSGDWIRNIAVDPLTGRFVGADGSGRLYDLDPLTGQTTRIGVGQGFQGYNAMCFDQNGVLWGQAGSDPRMVRIDLTTGSPSFVATGPYGLTGMVVRPEDGQMFAVSIAAATPNLYTVDTGTWTFTPVGPWHTSGPLIGVVGLAFVPSVPAPSSLAIPALGGLVWLRRRR